MFLSTLCGAVTSVALAGDVSPVSLLQAGDLARLSTPARCCFSSYITTKDWHQYLDKCAVLIFSV